MLIKNFNGNYIFDLQIIKCTNETCCKKMRSSWMNVVPTRFLRAPIPIVQSSEGLKIPSQKEHDGKKFATFQLMYSLHIDFTQDLEKLPYDYFCPSIKSEITRRTCKICGIYFCSLKAVKAHQKIHTKDASENDKLNFDNSFANCEKEVPDVEKEDSTSEINSPMPLTSIEENMLTCWVEDDQSNIL